MPYGPHVVPPRQAAEPVDRGTVDWSLWIFGVTGTLAVAALIGLAVVPRGRCTGWRATRSPSGLLGAGLTRTR